MTLELVDKGQVIDGKQDKPLKEKTTYYILEKILKKSRIGINHDFNINNNIIETKDYIIYRTYDNKITPQKENKERSGTINKGGKGRILIKGELQLRTGEYHGKQFVLRTEKRDYTLQELAETFKCSTMHLWNNLRDLSEVEIKADGVTIKGKMHVISNSKIIPFVWNGEVMYKELTYTEASKIMDCQFQYLYGYYEGFLQVREWVASEKDPRTHLDKMKYLGFTEDKIYINTSPKQLIEILKFNKGYDTVIRNLKKKGIIKDGEKKIIKGEYFKYD